MVKSLSIIGDITLPTTQIHKILQWYIYSYHDQTIFHVNKVKSLKHDIWRAHNDIDLLREYVIESLQFIYNNYFPGKEINVMVEFEEDGGRIYMKFDIEITLDKKYIVSDIVKIEGNKFSTNDAIIELYYDNFKGYI